MHRLNQLGLPLADRIAQAMASGQGTITPDDRPAREQNLAMAGSKPGPQEAEQQDHATPVKPYGSAKG